MTLVRSIAVFIIVVGAAAGSFACSSDEQAPDPVPVPDAHADHHADAPHHADAAPEDAPHAHTDASLGG